MLEYILSTEKYFITYGDSSSFSSYLRAVVATFATSSVSLGTENRINSSYYESPQCFHRVISANSLLINGSYCSTTDGKKAVLYNLPVTINNTTVTFGAFTIIDSRLATDVLEPTENSFYSSAMIGINRNDATFIFRGVFSSWNLYLFKFNFSTDTLIKTALNKMAQKAIKSPCLGIALESKEAGQDILIACPYLEEV